MTLDFALTILRDLDRPDADRSAILDERIAELDQASEFLKALKPLVLGGSPPGKPPAALSMQNGSPGKAARNPRKALPVSAAPSPSSSSGTTQGKADDKKRMIGEAILKNGPIKVADALQLLNCPRGSIANYLNSAWFQKAGFGLYDLTSFGREQMANRSPSH